MTSWPGKRCVDIYECSQYLPPIKFLPKYFIKIGQAFEEFGYEHWDTRILNIKIC